MICKKTQTTKQLGNYYKNKIRSLITNRNQETKIPELKNIMKELKILIENINNRFHLAKERISKLEDRLFEMIQLEERTKTNEKE